MKFIAMKAEGGVKKGQNIVLLQDAGSLHAKASANI